jgi:hypothetical protein
MEPPRPPDGDTHRGVGTAGGEMVRQFRLRPALAGEPHQGTTSMSSTSRFVLLAALAVIILAGGLFWLSGRSSAPATSAPPSVAREIDSLKSGTTVTAKAPFTGTCRENGKAFAFNVKGEVTSYANASRTLIAAAVKPQDALTANNYEPPASISLDSAWWEASGGKAGKITLTATGADARTQAPVSFACDVELPAA